MLSVEFCKEEATHPSGTPSYIDSWFLARRLCSFAGRVWSNIRTIWKKYIPFCTFGLSWPQSFHPSNQNHFTQLWNSTMDSEVVIHSKASNANNADSCCWVGKLKLENNDKGDFSFTSFIIWALFDLSSSFSKEGLTCSRTPRDRWSSSLVFRHFHPRIEWTQYP
jgi:hypothetical protein